MQSPFEHETGWGREGLEEDFKTQEQVWKQPYIHIGLILGWVLTRQCVGFFCFYV